MPSVPRAPKSVPPWAGSSTTIFKPTLGASRSGDGGGIVVAGACEVAAGAVDGVRAAALLWELVAACCCALRPSIRRPKANARPSSPAKNNLRFPCDVLTTSRIPNLIGGLRCLNENASRKRTLCGKSRKGNCCGGLCRADGAAFVVVRQRMWHRHSCLCSWGGRRTGSLSCG